MNLEQSLKENFARYAGMTIQQRALVDVRDGLKPSARMAMYAQYIEKIVHSKPYKKSAKSVATGMEHFYTHGDDPLYGLLMRLGKPFTSRYPLEDVQGNVGDLIESGNEAAYRYTEMRLSELASYLFENIDKDTIDLWFNNYDDTEQYPSVLPSLGFYNIVNGTGGIAVAIASSIPQFNLREVNEALIKLLWNPNIPFDEIYCVPDFATGATLINEEEVKQSLKVGYGKACKLRSTISYDATEHCLVVTEIPYGVYTNTICNQLSKILDGENNYGIERFIDLTKEGIYPHIKIFLTKKANPDRVAKILYKETSLQYHYTINMEMLKDGKTPETFGWKAALSAHLEHEKIGYRKAFEFDLRKLKARLHIVEGILIALARIEEVIATIKGSSSSSTAKTNLMEKFGFSELQAKAILDIKLVRLANLEIEKVEKEKRELISEISRIENILSDQNLLFKEIENGLREVMNKFADTRRTKVLNLSYDEDNNEEPAEKKALIMSLTNLGNIYTTETSTLVVQRRGGVGSKFKLQDGEYITDTITDTNFGTALFFSNQGRFFSYSLANLPVNEKLNVGAFLTLDPNERITNMVAFNKRNDYKYIVFVTKQGMIKKSELEEYNTKRTVGVQALKINNGDELCQILFMNEESISLLTEAGQCVVFTTKDIRPIGRLTAGVKSIKLNADDKVVSACVIPKGIKEFVSIANDGLIKRTEISEVPTTGRNIKGTRLQKIKDDKGYLVDFLPIVNERDIIVISSSASIKIPLNEIPLSGKNAQGAKAIKLKDNENIIALVKNL